MTRQARKIKIRVYKGRWFRLILPAISFQLLMKICRLGFKFCKKEDNTLAKDIDIKELMTDIDLFLSELSRYEPFILAEVSEETEKIYVKIETV